MSVASVVVKFENDAVASEVVAERLADELLSRCVLGNVSEFVMPFSVDE